MHLRVRTIDLALPLVAITAIAVATDPPRLVEAPRIDVPVTGSISDPCSGEKLTFAGTTDVNVWAEPNGVGGFDVRLNANLAGAETTTESGSRSDLAGIVNGRARAAPPYPATLPLEGHGLITSAAAGDELTARMRFQVTVTEQGSAAPTGSAEVLALECRR